MIAIMAEVDAYRCLATHRNYTRIIIAYIRCIVKSCSSIVFIVWLLCSS